MGIRIMDNFKTPYLAKNISEFWQRWHISLSTWFRDYLYFPLGGNRVTKYRWLINILIVFIASGIWHGANWTFLIWGALFGFIYLIEKKVNAWFRLEKECRPYSGIHILLSLKTFVLVSFIWVFFRSQNFSEAINIFKLIFTNSPSASSSLEIPFYIWWWFALFIFSDVLLYNNRFDTWVSTIPFAGRWIMYSVLVFAIIVFAGVENFPFIYFQF